LVSKKNIDDNNKKYLLSTKPAY